VSRLATVRTAPLRVLHVVSSNQRRGAETSAVELAERLADNGMRTQVVALAPADVPVTLDVVTLGRHQLGLSTLTRLRRLVRDADVVIAHGSRTLPAVAVAAAATRATTVYQNIGDPLFWAGSGLRLRRVRALLGRMGYVAALTSESLEVLHAHFGVPRDRLMLMPNMRDGQRFRPADAEGRLRARQALGLTEDDRVVVVVGALSPEKRVHLAIAAGATDPRLTLLVAGDGSLRADLEHLAETSAPGRVRFLGNVADTVPVLQAADVLVLTSESEGVPGVLIEAGLCGLPAVTSVVGYVGEVVLDGTTGRFVDDGDPETFGRAVEEAYGQREAWGAAAREHCMAHFDTGRVVEDWLEFLSATKPAPRR
jgi:glycosyltransferase involved in cell wall biosynthesis